MPQKGASVSGVQIETPSLRSHASLPGKEVKDSSYQASLENIENHSATANTKVV